MRMMFAVLVMFLLLGFVPVSVHASRMYGIVVGNVSNATIDSVGLKNVTTIRDCTSYRGCGNCMHLLGNKTGFILIVKDANPVAVIFSGSNTSKLRFASPLSSIIPVVKGNNVTYVSKTPYQNFLICLKTSSKCPYRSGGFYMKSLFSILAGTVVLAVVVYIYNRRENVS